MAANPAIASPEEALFAEIKAKLYTAVLGDVMDAMGLTSQFLPPEIRALVPGTVIAGRAMTVQEADCAGDTAVRGGAEPFGLMFEALDDLKPGEIYICTGSSPTYALWGGLMSTRAAKLGAVGAVLDGYHRDTREILGLGFPIFSAGSYAQDQRVRGRVIDYRCPLRFGNGCRVENGDLVVADIDGVVIVPARHEKDVLAAAFDKVRGENDVRDMILAGETTTAIFAKTGIM
ncbi:RraA family protein [Bosea sp. SSUT16]|uniref:Putative 4-hydroxy-4-methyl-2-oxoglutarate aldolase n=1 Tax=Bosea spartocytisi TaxID=2773451 RepID=A0A927I0M7_9HYPH|nr:RraA family protein [Bosea spartocytisi]MBD3845563.1 RraA family protein [Bosea spartocytisi]MCT4472856.1 RraA family protein [Bosea spartocytisi]